MLRKIIWYSTLLSLVLTVVLVVMMLKKPSIPSLESGPEALKSCEEKLATLAQTGPASAPREIRLTSEELNAEVRKSITGTPQPQGPATLKQATVYLDGDQIVGVFDVEMKGVDLYLTVRGGLAFENHTARLLPDRVKLGTLPIPVSWLQGKLNMTTDLPENVTGLRVENSELVVQAQ